MFGTEIFEIAEEFSRNLQQGIWNPITKEFFLQGVVEYCIFIVEILKSES